MAAHTKQYAKLCDDTKAVKVLWKDGESQSYPYVWLRDSCRCEKCFHPTAAGRMTAFEDFDTEVAPDTVELEGSEENCVLKVIWLDGHISEYRMHWLGRYTFNPADSDPHFDIKPRLWDANVAEKQVQFFDFNELMACDKALYHWLVEIQEFGLAVVQNAPLEMGQVQNLGKRVSYLLVTDEGPTYPLQCQNTPENIGFLSSRLSLHADMPYRELAPGAQIIHCINQANIGGESVFSDGFKAAEKLKREDPASYNILTSTVLEFTETREVSYYGGIDHHQRHPTIELDDRKNVAAIYWSDGVRDPLLRIPETKVLPFYRAMKKFCDLFSFPGNVFKYKMGNGDMVCFNNRRVLHGREEYTVTETNVRCLEIGYLEWDQLNSKIRRLRRKIGINLKTDNA